MRRSLAAVAVASILSISAPAGAQDASAQAAAQALFEQARQLMTEGKYAEACPKLAESQRLDPGAGTLLNLGHCYEKNGQTASAWVTFKDAAAAADLKHRDDWSQRARERSQAIAPLLSRLTIDVPADARPDGLQVRRDGVNVGPAEWGVPIPVDPGDHVITALAPGKRRWETTVKVGPNAQQEKVTVAKLEDEPQAAVAVPAAAPTPAAQPAPEAQPAKDAGSLDSDAGSTQRTLALVSAGVGIVGLGLGTAFGVMAMGNESHSKDLCPNTPCTNAEGVSANSDAQSQATISTIGFVAGGALLATGAVLWFTAPKARSATAIHVAPTVASNGAGLSLGGAW